MFPEVWRDRSRFRRLLAALRDYGVNALLTESDSYEEAAIDAAHVADFRVYAGVACFSENEWLLILSGVLAIAFGVLMIAQPAAAALAVIWMIGIFALLFGSMIALALKLKKFKRPS